MPITIPPLPYPKDALAPYIGAETVEVHYEKHHRGYLKKLLAAKPDLASWRDLDAIVREGPKDLAFNNAAQFWNHCFYWRSLAAPDGRGNEPSMALRDTIGDPAVLRQQLKQAPSKHFGSGWAWLVLDDAGKTTVVTTHDAGNPLTDGKRPLLTVDLWEHAWYLDRRSEKDAYLEAVIDHLVNWHFVETNLTQLAELDGTKGMPEWSPQEGWRLAA